MILKKCTIRKLEPLQIKQCVELIIYGTSVMQNASETL